MPTLTRYIEATDTEVEIEFDYRYESGSRDYFDKGFGNWLPGDPELFEITSAKLPDGTQTELTDEEEQEAMEIAQAEMEASAEDAAISRYEDRMEPRDE